MKTVIFDGYLKTLYPTGIQLDASSAAEAIGLLQNIPGFRPTEGVTHRVRMPDFPSRDSFYDKTDREELRVTPIDPEDPEFFSGSGGSKTGAWVQLIVGAVIMYFSYGTAGEEMFGAGAAGVFMAGAGMALGGLMQMLMPAPPKSVNSVDDKSNYLAANKNTVAVGTTIPLLLGKHKVFGHMLSFNVTATNIAAPALIPAQEVSEAVSNDGEVVYNNYWNEGGE